MPALAEAIARAVQQFDPQLRLFGLANSALIEARAIGLPVAAEAFADRRYCANGSLQPRRESGAVIEDVAQAPRKPSASPRTTASLPPMAAAYHCMPTPCACTATARMR
jgi:lactam utilization protein B